MASSSFRGPIKRSRAILTSPQLDDDARSNSQRRRTIGIGAGERVPYPEPVNRAASAVMRGNRKRDTKPELAVRRLLHASGYRYRVNVSLTLSGTRIRPDIVVRRARLAIFIDGCFWHGCPKHGTKPRSNASYWGPKITRNIARDRSYDRALKMAGWTVIRAWEHDDPARVVTRIGRVLARVPC
jgi:DNA mismatch endonuclease, patch repair protein